MGIPDPPSSFGSSTAEFVNAAWSYAVYILWPMVSPLVTMMVGLGLGLWLVVRSAALYRKFFISGGTVSERRQDNNDDDF